MATASLMFYPDLSLLGGPYSVNELLSGHDIVDKLPSPTEILVPPEAPRVHLLASCGGVESSVSIRKPEGWGTWI